MRLHRPYIPLAVRVQVAERMLGLKSHSLRRGNLAAILKGCLTAYFGNRKVALDHDPALVNRERRVKRDGTVVYVPDANDPNYLVYRVKHDHDIKTRVRGDGAQLSDLAIARKRKRKERKAKQSARRWPSRPFPKRAKR